MPENQLIGSVPSGHTPNKLLFGGSAPYPAGVVTPDPFFFLFMRHP